MPSRLFWVLRRVRGPRPRRRPRVSMPSRLFWVLRLYADRCGSATDSCFNAFAAFLGSATERSTWPPRVSLCFNAFAAFLGSATVLAATLVVRLGPVSMPSRLFWVLRHRLKPPVRGRARPVSMPSRLFWVLRLTNMNDVSGRDLQFQCLRGFSGFCDATHSELTATSVGFNAFAAFLGSATLRSLGYSQERSLVSMPSRLFWVLRPPTIRFSGGGQSVSMPSRLFWVLRLERVERDYVDPNAFQCLRGFSGFCDIHEIENLGATVTFQCLRGFSGFCDVLDEFSSHGSGYSFQCLRGFSGFCDPCQPPASIHASRFQCLRGFSGFCDTAGSGRGAG